MQGKRGQILAVIMITVLISLGIYDVQRIKQDKSKYTIRQNGYIWHAKSYNIDSTKTIKFIDVNTSNNVTITGQYSIETNK